MKKTITMLAVILFAVPQALAGGGWTQKKGQGYYKLSEWWIVFDQHYTDVGLIDPNLTSGIFNTNFYAEHGFSDRLTGIVNATLFSRSYMNNLRSSVTNQIIIEGDAVNAMGDIDLGLKYGITRSGSKVALAGTMLLGLPTGKAEAGRQGNLQTGDGEFNQMLRVDAGAGLYSNKIINTYANAYAAVNNRTRGFSDEFRYGAEVGLGAFQRRLWLIAKYNVVESMKNGDAAEMAASIFANNTEYKSYGFEVSGYVTKQMGVSAGFDSAFQGVIIAAAPSYNVGIFLDMSR